MANIKNEALAYALKEQDWDTPRYRKKNKARYLKLRSLDRKNNRTRMERQKILMTN